MGDDTSSIGAQLARIDAEIAELREQIRSVREEGSHEEGEGSYIADLEGRLAVLEHSARQLRAAPAPPPAPATSGTYVEDPTGQYDDGHGLPWSQPTTHPPPPGAPDTGHYDDGHSFGWPQASSPDEPGSPETGHYDDGHGFGWPAQPPREPPSPSSGTVRWWLPVLVGVAAVAAVAVTGLVVLGGSDGAPGAHAGASAQPSVAASSTDEVTGSPAGDAAQPVPPIEVRSTCPGPCASEDSHCNFTFHWTWQLFESDKQTPDTTHDGEQAVIATNGHGMRPSYQVAVGAGGQVVLDTVARGADWGGNRDNGCYVPGVTFAAAVVSVGGHPTSTPEPPA
jgi:hypothetical protein